MAYPIDTKGNKVVTLKISNGAGFHSIMDSLGCPSDDWCRRAVDFDILIPYVDRDGKIPCKPGEISVSFVPVAMKRIDVINRFTFGCYRAQELRESGINFLKDPPIQITNYSTKTRKGFVEVSVSTYRHFVSLLTEGVCY